MRSTLLARCLRSHHYPTPFRHPARMSPLFLCFPSGWTGRGCVQPAAEPRHVQRHNHALNVWERTNAVWGAQRALPAATTVERSLHVACATAASPTPYCFPSRVSPFFRCFPFDAAASVGVQPAAKLRHVQRHKHAIHVYGALYACPASSLHSWALPARCLRRHRYFTHSRLPARMPPLFLCTPLDSAGRVAVQPAAEPRHVQRRNHALHVSGLLRACPATNQPPHLGPPSTLLATPPLLYRYSTATPPLLYALPPPDPHAAPLPMHSFRLDRTRRRSTSR